MRVEREQDVEIIRRYPTPAALRSELHVFFHSVIDTAGGNGCFFWKQPIVNRFQGYSRSFFWEQPMQQVKNTLFPGCFHMEQ
jgi:hypothetical protein